MMNCKKRFTISMLFMTMGFLSGCAYFQKPPSYKPIPWKERQVELRQIDNWMMSGALSITQNKKRDSAHFQWLQKQNNYTINIAGPLNIGAVRIVGDVLGVEFWRTRKKCIKASTPEQLLQNQLGWYLPVSNLRYWIVALPAPKTKIDGANFDQFGHLIALNQSGWQIKYSEFQPYLGKKIELPNLIELTSNEIMVKLKIKTVQLYSN